MAAHEHHHVPERGRGLVPHESQAEPLRDASINTPDDETTEDVGSLAYELEIYLIRTEKVLGRPLPPGRGAAMSLPLAFDVVETRYRSCLWYTLVSLADFAFHCWPFWQGFRIRANWATNTNRRLADSGA